MNDTAKSIIAIFTAIVGVAIFAVLVSKSANTANVISAFTGGFAQDLSVAVSPVTGGSFTSGLSSLNSFTSSVLGGSTL